MIPVPSGEQSCIELIVFLLDLLVSMTSIVRSPSVNDLLVYLVRCPAECVSRDPAILVDGDGVFV